MKSKITLSIALLFVCSLIFSQADSTARKHRFLFWNYDDSNSNIYGVSASFATLSENPQTVNTFGARIEIIGTGILSIYSVFGPFPTDEKEILNENKPLSERVFGVSISPVGSISYAQINGFTAGGFGQILHQVNGISLTGGINTISYMNGIQFSFIVNNAYKTKGIQIAAINSSPKMRGLQIGVINASKKLRGVQIGLWNINEKRSLPFINWNFKKTDN